MPFSLTLGTLRYTMRFMTIERVETRFFRSKKNIELPPGSVEKINFGRILIVESPDKVTIKSSGDDFTYRDKKGRVKKVRFLDINRGIPDKVYEREGINNLDWLESRPSFTNAMIGKIGKYNWRSSRSEGIKE